MPRTSFKASVGLVAVTFTLAECEAEQRNHRRKHGRWRRQVRPAHPGQSGRVNSAELPYRSR
jgi:hypothetical protein